MAITPQPDKVIPGRTEFIYQREPGSESLIFAAVKDGKTELLVRTESGHAFWVGAQQLIDQVDLYRSLTLRGELSPPG